MTDIARIRGLVAFCAGAVVSRPAWALGDEVLVTMFAQAATVVVMGLVISIWPMPIKRRLLALGGLLAGVVVAWVATGDLPYRANAALITVVHVVLPIVMCVVGLWLGRNSKKTRARI